MTTQIALAWYEILQMLGAFFRQPTVIEVAGSLEIEGHANAERGPKPPPRSLKPAG